MTFLVNWAVSVIATALIFFSLSSFGVALSEIPKKASQTQAAENSVWKIKSPFGEGVGFFPFSGLFITSFDTASLVLTGGNIRNVKLSQGNYTLKVRNLRALSVYGLAVFETEPAEGSLPIAEDLSDPEEDLLIYTYSEGKFVEVKKKGSAFFSKSDLYHFPVGKYPFSLAEVKGSPVLNRQKEIAGVVLAGSPHTMLTLKSSYLKRFVTGKEGLDCTGSETIKDCIRKAMDTLKEKAYAEKDSLSQYLLALMYFRKKEEHWWVEWSRKGRFVFSGDRKISYRKRRPLAHRYNIKIGRSLSPIREGAFALMSSAAEQGLPEALFYLAMEYLSEVEYLSEEGGRIHSLQGIFHLVSEAAKQGLYLAHFQKALMLLEGKGTGKNVREALVELNKAADQNFIPALEKLASLYEGEEDILIITKDPRKVAEYRTRAADLGSSESEYRLAKMYLTGDGVEKNSQKAKEFLARAADKNHVLAQYDLGMMHYTGDNGATTQNPLEAYKWVKAAAEQGLDQATHILPEICESVWH